jgi:hypothetical protein
MTTTTLSTSTAGERIVDGRVTAVDVPVADLAHGELASRLAEHVVAGALVRKSVDDPVPFAVWWRVTDALRATVVSRPADAAEEVDAALAALEAEVEGVGRHPAAEPVTGLEDARSLKRARTLVVRLVFGTAATSPTLLHVRLARLRRALLASA